MSYKVCLLGNSDAGKTSIINSYLGLPIDTEVTVMANFKALPVHYNKDGIEKRVKFHVVDTAG
jgi:GTPase SAR1 family protein